MLDLVGNPEDRFSRVAAQIMWLCDIQGRKIVCGQARRTEPSTLQFTEHLARILLTKTNFCLKFQD